MLDKVKDFLTGGAALDTDKNGDATSREMQVATGVLLLEMAGVDEDYAPEEVQASFRAMEKQFGITDSHALSIMEEAENIRDDREKVDELIAKLNTNFDNKQRQTVLAMIWKVVISDQLVEKYEQHFAEQLRNRLQLNEAEAEEAKTWAMGGSV